MSRKTDREAAAVGAATEEAMKVTGVATGAMDRGEAMIVIEAVTKGATEATMKGTDRTGITKKATEVGMMPAGDTMKGTEVIEGMITTEEATIGTEKDKKVTEGIIKVAEAVRIVSTKGSEEGSRGTTLGAKTTRHSGQLTSREAAIRTINSPEKAATEVVAATNRIHKDSRRRRAIGPAMIEAAAPSSRRARQET